MGNRPRLRKLRQDTLNTHHRQREAIKTGELTQTLMRVGKRTKEEGKSKKTTRRTNQELTRLKG